MKTLFALGLALLVSLSIHSQEKALSRGMKITREQRDAWAAKTAGSDFNCWLDGLVKSNGRLDLEGMYGVARQYGISHEYRHLNPGQQRMIIGSKLRAVVPAEDYTSAG